MSKKMAEILRQAIRDSGLSARRLGEITGIKQQTISMFLGGQDIRLESTAQKLADHFGLILMDRRKKTRARKSS